MHSYLKSVGFSQIHNKKEISEIISAAIAEPTERISTVTQDGIEKVEITKMFGERIGLLIRGEVDQEGKFSLDYHIPYLKGNNISSTEETTIERHSDKEAYQGLCDDIKLGTPLIFYLQNMVGYLNASVNNKVKTKAVLLTALSKDAKIIMNIEKDESQIKSAEEETAIRNDLMAAARQGDQEAMELLAIEDIDTYTVLSKRTRTEDLLTIVDTYFMPHGIMNDEYSFLGDILDYKETINQRTNETIYLFTLKCSGVIFDVCINKEDLLGEPCIGRRFKGTAWFQGTVNFAE